MLMTRRSTRGKTLLVGLIAVLATGFPLSPHTGVAHAIDNLSVQRFPDCASPTSQYCVETLAFTPEGSSSEITFLDAVPNAYPAPTHPNTYVQISPLPGGFVYGKMLSTVQFSLANPSSSKLGPVTETGIPPGRYRIVIRTGQYRPHSMTIKGHPSGETPLSITKESDGNYKLEITATADGLVLSTDLSGCRNDATVCEASNAFVRALQGLVYLVPPDFSDNPSLVSPSVDVSQGLWVASNSTILDVKPEMNLIAKNLSLPAYGPHYVPTDFPTTGLTAEGSRYLNPAYFEMFIPTALVSFMANFTPQEIQDKAPGKIKATIEKSGKEEPAIHTLQVRTGGGLVTVKLDHYSAPNPRVYVGAADSTTQSETTTTTSTSVVPATSHPSPSAPLLTIPRRATLSLRTIAQRVGMTASSGSMIRGQVLKSSFTKCKISSGRVLGVSKGVCRIRVTVSSKKSKTVAQTVTATIT